MPVILRKFRENPSRLRQLSVIKKTQKFSKIGKIDKKLLKSSKNCYTGNIFKAAEKRAAKGFDRACRVFVALCLWLCMLLCLYAYGAVCCQGFLLLLVALIVRYCCYGVMLKVFAFFCAFMFAFYGSLYFCAVGVACRCGVMFLLLSFSAARGFRLFKLLKRSTAFLRR